MKPSELRSSVLAEHAELRKVLSEVIAVCAHALARGRVNRARLHAKARQMRAMLLRHIDLEDRLLYPDLLRDDVVVIDQVAG